MAIGFGVACVPVRVYIPTPFRAHTEQQTHVTVEAATVAELLARLADRYPGLRPLILTGDGAAPAHLNVYVNQVECRSLQAEATPLRDGDEVALVPAIAGGAGLGPLLDDEQLERYSRHIRLDEVGVYGQRRLLDSRVLIVGAGALASPAAIYLAAAGVGTIGIVDGDRVDASNLQRQILHFTHDVGRPKVVSARRHLEDLNPDVRVETHNTFLTADNAKQIVAGYDLVINGSDNFPTRYLVNDVCVMLRKPLVDASILKWEGQATVFLPGHGCYRCLFPSPPPPGSVPSCAEGGVLGALAGHMGTLQAIEAVKVLLGIGEPLSSRLVLVDALAGDYQVLRWQRNPNCPVCGDRPTITELIDYEGFCGLPALAHEDDSTPARDAAADAGWELAPAAAAERLRAGARLIDVREPHEYGRVRIAGAELLPLEEALQRLDELPRDRDLIFVCRIGERSAVAVEAARRAGLQRAFNLAGGIVAWMNQRLPVEQGTAPRGAPA
jgi:molybdopterin/thiamine biosynthesis adenylyltransferase/rhodanese-related sulfurtransferase/molybdopterin converting factor small subunit